MPQTLIKDATIEMVMKILSHNQKGCCVYADELSGFMSRMTKYKDSDEPQKWLELWSGANLTIQRITRKESKVEDSCCSIVGGIQPGVLESLSKGQNEHNGFYHRFLFVYPEPQQKPDWQKITIPVKVFYEYDKLFRTILDTRLMPNRMITYSPKAADLYGRWFNQKNSKYNGTNDNNIKGIIAKYQEYCHRFALIIEVMNNPGTKEVCESSVDKAIRLTEYFFANIHKAMKILAPDTPVDKLSDHMQKLYNELPQMFSLKAAKEVAVRHKVKETTLKAFLSKGEGKLVKTIKRGEYERIY